MLKSFNIYPFVHPFLQPLLKALEGQSTVAIDTHCLSHVWHREDPRRAAEQRRDRISHNEFRYELSANTSNTWRIRGEYDEYMLKRPSCFWVGKLIHFDSFWFLSWTSWVGECDGCLGRTSARMLVMSFWSFGPKHFKPFADIQMDLLPTLQNTTVLAASSGGEK